MTIDEALIADIFTAEGASSMTWEVASRCNCYTADSHQPQWDHEACGGTGVLYAAAVIVRGLFRSQQRWRDPEMMGELQLGEAMLTLPLDVKPNYVDRRVRDRFTVVNATGDAQAGRIFVPAAQPVPFMFGDKHLAWRVQIQSLEQTARVTP